MKSTKLFLFAALFYLPTFCFAWSQEGHRIAGEIASRHLTPKARQAVAAILGKESIAIVSNWADFMKSDSAYAYLNIWHYVDLPDSLNFAEAKNFLKSDTAIDAYTKINFLSSQLKDKTLLKTTKQMYLKLLIHIVEDIHQPLHTVGTARGGNEIKITWFGEASNLHRVWDANLIESQQLSYTEYANALDTASNQQIKTWQNQPLSKWIFDSYSIGETLTGEMNAGNEKLGYEYNYKHIAILNKQLLKAGIDLAKILNDIFG